MTKQTTAKIEAALNAVAEQVKTDKGPSGMNLAKAVYARITAEGYELPEGKKLRGHFIDVCMTEVGLKKNAAATYYSNIQREAAGGKLYQTTSKKKDATAEQIASTPNAGDIFRALPVAEDADSAVNEEVDPVAEEVAEPEVTTEA